MQIFTTTKGREKVINILMDYQITIRVNRSNTLLDRLIILSGQLFLVSSSLVHEEMTQTFTSKSFT